MAKTTGPLLSQQAHGTLGNILTYSKRQSGQQVRKINKPLKEPSAKQLGHRRLVSFITTHWKYMSDADKTTWATNAKALGKYISGYHYFLHSALLDPTAYHGLVGYWPCNREVNGQIFDLSSYHKTGNFEPNYPISSPRLVNSPLRKFGKALDYSGADWDINLAIPPQFNIATNFMLEIWVIFPSTSFIPAQILGKGTGSSPTTSWAIWTIDNEKIRFWLSDGAYQGIESTGWTPKANTLYCIAGTYNGTTARLFINGAVNNSREAAFTIQATDTNFFMGRSNIGHYWNGIMDEVCLYDRPFSIAEMAERYTRAIA